ncbi:hypothetical protein [Amycolatopsis sp. NPDC057786]|uniref:hypothetical protein n=1 Tax=Amycolatopsis sp. NPDC057786 TaxID=3346250 RepID=UPI00366B249C
MREQIRTAAEELEVSGQIPEGLRRPVHRAPRHRRPQQVGTVVVGASQKTGHRFAGSVATKLIRSGHWPVLVAP